MSKNKNRELIRQIGLNPLKPDSFQIVNEPLINNLFQWSDQNIDLQDIFLKFFGLKVKTKIVAILLDLDLNSWIGLAGSWQHNNQNGQIRIDEKLADFLLNQAFGPSPVNQPFSIKRITQMEIQILQGFLSGVESKMREYWEVDVKHGYLLDLIYLVWLIESEEGEVGRISYGIPACLKPKKTMLEGKQVIDINKLANTGIRVPISLKVGSTRVPVNDVKSLDPGDLLVFEDSDISKFYWHLGEISLVLPESDHPVFLKGINNINQLAKEMAKNPQTYDDDPLSSLPLELSAEFQKVLIPLKQVLELKSGGVLPLGPVLDSELVLTAQGKPVAKGELVIVGNQFGMRITELLIGTKKGAKGATGSSSTVEIDDLLGKGQQTKTEQSSSFADALKDLEET
jgi:flagellar motor switch/type III secretory pathway protein FliN